MPLETKKRDKTQEYRISCDLPKCPRATGWIDNKDWLVREMSKTWFRVRNMWFCPQHKKEANRKKAASRLTSR